MLQASGAGVRLNPEIDSVVLKAHGRAWAEGPQNLRRRRRTRNVLRTVVGQRGVPRLHAIPHMRPSSGTQRYGLPGCPSGSAACSVQASQCFVALRTCESLWLSREPCRGRAVRPARTRPAGQDGCGYRQVPGSSFRPRIHRGISLRIQAKAESWRGVHPSSRRARRARTRLLLP